MSASKILMRLGHFGRRPANVIRRAAVTIIAGALMLGSSAAPAQTPAQTLTQSPPRSASNATPFVVAELFTSQGCSSCPPADTVLSQLDAAARETGAAVYPLSFHVDYWNYLGWRDPYSDAAFSRRQRQYASVMRSSRVYTPQIIINGDDEMVGSKAKLVRRSVAKALAKSPSATLDLVQDSDGVQYRFGHSDGSVPSEHVIHFALASDAHSVAVRRGENSGRSLAHVNVVRKFRTETLAETGPVPAELVAGLSADDPTDLVAYVQSIATGRIIAADRISSND